MPFQHADFGRIGDRADGVVLDPTKVLTLRVLLAVAGLELDARLAGVGIHFAADHLAQELAAVGQSDLGHCAGQNTPKPLTITTASRTNTNEQHSGQRRRGRPDQRLAAPPKPLPLSPWERVRRAGRMARIESRFRRLPSSSPSPPAPLPTNLRRCRRGESSSEPAEPFSQTLADQLRRRVHRERQQKQKDRT